MDADPCKTELFAVSKSRSRHGHDLLMKKRQTEPVKLFNIHRRSSSLVFTKYSARSVRVLAGERLAHVISRLIFYSIYHWLIVEWLKKLLGSRFNYGMNELANSHHLLAIDFRFPGYSWVRLISADCKHVPNVAWSGDGRWKALQLADLDEEARTNYHWMSHDRHLHNWGEEKRLENSPAKSYRCWSSCEDQEGEWGKI